MKKLMLLGTFLLMFSGISSICSAAELKIITELKIIKGNITYPAGAKPNFILEVHVRINGALVSTGPNGFQNILETPFSHPFTPGDKIEIAARGGRWLLGNPDYAGEDFEGGAEDVVNKTIKTNSSTGNLSYVINLNITGYQPSLRGKTTIN